MTRVGTKGRNPDAGVTLLEMLVVLSIIATVSAAAVLSVPARKTDLSADLGAEAFAADIDRAMNIALAEGEGFAIAMEGKGLRFLQRGADGAWQPHAAPHLKEVKLFPAVVRIFDQDNKDAAIFAVSGNLIPDRVHPLRVEFGDNGSGSTVIYDGANVRISRGENNQGATRPASRILSD